MATSPVQFIKNTLLTNSSAQIGTYQTPASATDKIYEFIFCNTHTAPVGVEIYLVPSGGSASASNKILDSDSFVLQAGETRRFGLEQRLDAGSQVHGLATVTNVVSVHLAGDRVTP